MHGLGGADGDGFRVEDALELPLVLEDGKEVENRELIGKVDEPWIVHRVPDAFAVNLDESQRVLVDEMESGCSEEDAGVLELLKALTVGVHFFI